MELVVVIVGLLVVLGLLGCVLPILPGAPLVWVAILVVHLSGMYEYSIPFLVITALVTMVVEALDYLLPAWLAKRGGGTKWGQKGALVGMIAGLFLGPLGMILGTAIGAVAGELLQDSSNLRKAIKAGGYSLLGFFLSVGVGLLWAGYLAWETFKGLKASGNGWLI